VDSTDMWIETVGCVYIIMRASRHSLLYLFYLRINVTQ